MEKLGHNIVDSGGSKVRSKLQSDTRRLGTGLKNHTVKRIRSARKNYLSYSQVRRLKAIPQKKITGPPNLAVQARGARPRSPPRSPDLFSDSDEEEERDEGGIEEEGALSIHLNLVNILVQKGNILLRSEKNIARLLSCIVTLMVKLNVL